ncbi:MAG TPA: hypothetical protein VEF72_32815 [Mycobacterium sp.]|nr:hypothetical protein [Mycobacterium sp.]
MSTTFDHFGSPKMPGEPKRVQQSRDTDSHQEKQVGVKRGRH